MANTHEVKEEATPHPTNWGGLALFLLLALSLAFQLGVLDEKFNLGDEGVALVGAWRISQGEVPHRDYFEIVPPVSFLPTAAVFKVFGAGLLQSRLLALAYSLLLLFLVDALLKRLGTSPWGRAFALAFLTPFGIFYWPMPSHHWVADLFLLGAVLALVDALSEGTAPPMQKGLAFLSGACVALCGLSLQDQGGYLALALGFGVLLWLRREAGEQKTISLPWLLGLASVAALAALLLIPLVGARELFFQWVLFPATRYKEIADNATGFFAGWEGIVSLWSSGGWATRPLFSVALSFCTGILFLLPFLALASLFYLFRSRTLPRHTSAVLAAGAVACLGTAAHRWSITNAVWAAPALLLPVVVALSRYGSEDSPRPRRAVGRAFFLCGTVLFVLFGATYYQGSHQYGTARIQTPAGSLRSVQGAEVARVNQIMGALDTYVPDGAPLFCDGYIPLLNFLSLHPNPTRYQFLSHPGYHTDAQAQEVLHSLRSSPEAWVLLTKPLDPTKLLDDFVVAEYEPVWENGAVVLYRRKLKEPLVRARKA